MKGNVCLPAQMGTTPIRTKHASNAQKVASLAQVKLIALLVMQINLIFKPLAFPSALSTLAE
jgi:hypothetical protein